MRERFVLQERVQLLGAVDHAKVPEVLVQGQIFLNTSLTEAFCIAIVEAACCGLLVVSTKVGGVPEVLPDDMIIFSQPEELDLFRSIETAIKRIQAQPIDHWEFHNRVKSMYSWKDVAERTANVYDMIMDAPDVPLIERMYRFSTCGLVAGPLSVMIVAVNHVLWLFLEWFVPRDSIDKAPWVGRKALAEYYAENQDYNISPTSKSEDHLTT
ncbi:hypothetical protein HK097_007320 [Rhizophlyctis rosea]|uniref:Glycosyl transferase family 1 domain-containing protein n=1 Tax=Rhizophlyctis rosea TaxID=64517 RepID=A0AAD5SJM9_9FUNG|nr:hypothetical protein HK097_007320 [Rhizophlyctis rosea]